MIPWEWWGDRVRYADAWARQRDRRDRIGATGAGEALALLTHRPVVTFGRRDAPDNPVDSELSALGLDVFHTERGGLATWHGPGQLVGYLLCDLTRRRLRVRHVVAGLEEGLAGWLGALGLAASTREGYPGVWIGRDKICAIGLSVQHGVSMHGFALNLHVEPGVYGPIVPCGITDGGVTSAHRLRPGATPQPREAAPEVARAVLRALEARVGA